MELTVEQALQQGVAAHKEGKLEEAERLYRAIMQTQPLHPDANHNLGVLAVSMNKTDVALPLFKTALEANPKIEQFWLSYIEALIKEKQLDNANEVLEKAKKQGVGGERLNSLEVQLLPKNQKPNIEMPSPPEELLNSLLGYYQNGRFTEAEKLSLEITQNFPRHQFAWKVLSAVLRETGRKSEAADVNQTVVELSPQDAEAHNNLGVTLKELGRLDEAEASYNQAIALKPDYAKAHNNLGNTLQELGRLDEAEASCLRALALNSDFAEAHNNLGITLKKLGRLNEAEASYNQAIALKSDAANVYNNLGVTLKELGRLNEAEASCLKAITLKPGYVEALYNLSIVQRYMNNLKAEILSLQNVLQLDFDNFGLRAGVNLAIQNFLEGNFDESKKHLMATTKIQEKTSSTFNNEKVYWKYLLKILKWHQNRYLSIKKESHDKNLYVIGESHSLTSHHLRIQNSGIDFFCSASLIKGCKQWHLGNTFRNQYKHQFESIFLALPKNSYVLLAIGEIDCRLETGIIAHKKKFPEKKIKEIILTTLESYLTYIENNNFNCQHKVIIQGIPCPNIDIRNHSDKDIKQLVEVIKIFNYELKIQSKEKGFKFLDIHELTNKGDGLSNGSWHIDDYHLSPGGMQEAWQKYISE